MSNKNLTSYLACKLTSIRPWNSSQPMYRHNKSLYPQPGRCGREDSSLTVLHARPREKRPRRRIRWPRYCPWARRPGSECNCDVLSAAPSLGLLISAPSSSAAPSLDPRVGLPCRLSRSPGCCCLVSMPRNSRRPCGQPMCPYGLLWRHPKF